MMLHSEYYDTITFEMAYDDAITLIKRIQATLEADLRNCIEEIAKDYAEYETSELKRQVNGALDRHNKVIDRLFALLHRREKKMKIMGAKWSFNLIISY